MCFIFKICFGRKIQTETQQTRSVNQNIITAQPQQNAKPNDLPISQTVQSQQSSRFSEVFAVPLELVPPNLDLNDPRVEHMGDHIRVKDLSLIEQRTDYIWSMQHNQPSTSKDVRYIENDLPVLDSKIHPLQPEEYKKPPCYNPNYF